MGSRPTTPQVVNGGVVSRSAIIDNLGGRRGCSNREGGRTTVGDFVCGSRGFWYNVHIVVIANWPVAVVPPRPRVSRVLDIVLVRGLTQVVCNNVDDLRDRCRQHRRIGHANTNLAIARTCTGNYDLCKTLRCRQAPSRGTSENQPTQQVPLHWHSWPGSGVGQKWGQMLWVSRELLYSIQESKAKLVSHPHSKVQ